MKKKKKPSNLNEPVISYKGFDIEFYKTFEEKNEAQIQEMSELTLEERLKFIKEIILKTYNETEESLRKRPNRRKLTIVK